MGGVGRRRLGLERRAAVLSQARSGLRFLRRSAWRRRAGSDPAHAGRGLAAAVAGDAWLCAGAANSLHRRHERRLPRRLLLGADEQLAGQAGVRGDLLSRCGCRSRSNLIVAGRRPWLLLFDGQRAVREGNVGGATFSFWPRDHRVARRHPLARHADVRASGRRIICANMASRCVRTCPASAAICPITPSCSWRSTSSRMGGRRLRCVRTRPRCSGSRRVSRLSARRHVHQRPEQDLLECARPPDRQPRAGAVEAVCARTGVAHRADPRQEPLVEFNFVGHELDLQRFKIAFAAPSICSPTLGCANWAA